MLKPIPSRALRFAIASSLLLGCTASVDDATATDTLSEDTTSNGTVDTDTGGDTADTADTGGDTADTGGDTGGDDTTPDLTGSWSGELTQKGYGTYPANMTITALVGGAPAGTSEYPSFPCDGALTYVSESKGVHTLSETITSGTGCVDGSHTVEMIDENTITVTWTDAVDPLNTATGALIRL